MAEVTIDIVGRDNFSSTLGNFGSIITGIESAINLVTGAFRVASDAIRPFIDSAMESELAVANLDATLASMGDVTGFTSEQLQGFASEIQNYTRYSDEAIINTEAMLLTFGNIGGDIFPAALDATVDLAAKFGSLDQASVMLGKALNDPIAGVTALRRVGVQLSEEQEESIKKFMEQNDIASAQGIILTEVNRQVGGLADAYGDTLAGKMDIAKNKMGELQETIGKALLPVLSGLLDKIMEFADNNPAIQGFMDFMGHFNELASSGVPILQALGMTFKDIGADSEWISRANMAFQELGIVLIDMQRVLDNGGTFFEALERALERLAAGDGPLSQVANQILTIKETFEEGGVLGLIQLGIASIPTEKIIAWLDDLDAQMADAVEAHDWTASGDAFGEMIGAMFSGDGSFDSAESQFIPALGQALSDWFLAAAGVPNWTAFKDTLWGIIKTFVIQPITENIRQNWVSMLFPMIPNDEARRIFRENALAAIAGFREGLDTIDANFNAWVTDHIINPIKRFLGIASPSRVFFYIGKDIIQGLIDGIDFMLGPLDEIVTGVFNLITGGSGGTRDGASATFAGFGTSTGSVGGRDMSGLTTSGGVLAGGTVTNIYNFYAPVYMSGVGPEGTYDCPPSPLLSSQSMMPIGGR